MSQKSSRQTLPLLKVGNFINVKSFEELPELSAYIMDIFEDGFGAMVIDENPENELYFEMYDSAIDDLVEIVG